MENENYLKLYNVLLEDTNTDLYETLLLCLYIKKYKQYKKIIVTDTKDAEILKFKDPKYVRYRRQHLKEVHYIDYESGKGKKTTIRINPKILEMIGELKNE